MTQAGLICLQAIPIVNAALAVKESVEMFTPARNLAMSKCYQEISAPGWIKVLEKAETMSLGFPPRTTRTGCTAQRSGHVCVRVCVSFEQCRIARDYYCCCSRPGSRLKSQRSPVELCSIRSLPVLQLYVSSLVEHIKRPFLFKKKLLYHL